MGLWVCHKRKALFSIIEVDIYLFANNEKTVKCGRLCPQIGSLAIKRNATQNIQTVKTSVKKMHWNSCFEVNCRTLHAPRQEKLYSASHTRDTSYIVYYKVVEYGSLCQQSPPNWFLGHSWECNSGYICTDQV